MDELSGGGERERSFTWETPCYDDQSQTDLILAAKLGKSLLEQNEELSTEYYKIVRKLETATQENFELRKQLDLAEETNVALIAELQAEISQLKEKIIEKNQRGSSELFLREEIERLNFQLTESVQSNNNAAKELKAVHESLRREKLCVEEQIQDCKSLKSERNILAEKKEDLEKQNIILKLEKESLSNSLENALCKISSLERRQYDQEAEMRLSDREMEELKTSNNYLLEKLELWSMSHSSSPTLRTSLRSELELSTSDSDTSLQRSKQFDIINEEDEEDIEEFEILEEINDISKKDIVDTLNFKEEIKGIELKMTKLNQKLKLKSGLSTPATSSLLDSSSPSSSSSSPSSSPIKISKLHYVVEELEILINDHILNRKFDLLNKGCQTVQIIDETENDIRIELTEELQKSKIKLTEMENETAQVNFAIKGLCEKLVILETRLKDVLMEKNELLETLKRNGETKRHKTNITRERHNDRLNEKDIVVVSEQNNNDVYQLSFSKQFERLEGMIKHILETKDPPKRRLARR